MKRVVSALLAGALFGLGLAVSRMTDPTVILGFLDLFGHFDPSLACVMVTLIGFRVALGRAQPLLDDDFHVPTVQAIDRPLVIGSAIFGIGWGLAGYCPGPALVALAGSVGTAFVFVPAMIAGSLIQRFVFQRRAGV